LKGIIYIELRQKINFLFKNERIKVLEAKYPNYTFITLDNHSSSELINYVQMSLSDFEEINIYIEDYFPTGINHFRTLFNKVIKEKNCTNIYTTNLQNTVLKIFCKGIGIDLKEF